MFGSNSEKARRLIGRIPQTPERAFRQGASGRRTEAEQGEFRSYGSCHHWRTIALNVKNTAINGRFRIPGGIHDPELVLSLA
jgi:hypothetical protein